MVQFCSILFDQMMQSNLSIITPKNGILVVNTLLTGLLAGVFFTWTNAITPGIGLLEDLEYLQAFQHMNRTILNPLFYVVIMGPVLLSFASFYFHKSNPKIISRLTISAAAFYLTGVFLVTLLGNIPLNDLLDKTNLADMSLVDAKVLRGKFETPWNNLHLIRTITSASSFLLLIISCLFSNNNLNK